MSKNDWTEKQIEFLLKNFATAPKKILETELKRSFETIYYKASKFGLKRDKQAAYQNRNRIYQDKWSSEEIKKLKQLAQICYNRNQLFQAFIKDYPNRTENAVFNKLKIFKLKISENDTSKQISIGQTFNYWKILSKDNKKQGGWLCLCTACNITKKSLRGYDLRNQITKSCGCIRSEIQKQTNLDKYNVIHPMQLKEFQQKACETNFKKYGLKYSAQRKEVKEKAKKTSLKRYGVDYYSKTAQCKEKTRKTNLDRYGVANIRQLPEYRFTLRNWCDQNPKNNQSDPELEILNWAKQFYQNSYKKRSQGNEIDVFISDLKIGIEHNGLYWHSEARVNKDYHIKKTEYFKKQDIRIIHVFEHEWKFRKDQVKSFLLSAINKNKHKIYSRKCKFIWSNDKDDIREVEQFLEDYHIQGHTKSTKYVIKVIYNDELIGCATFGKHHRNSTDWVLTRFCTKTDYTIVGGLSKISKIGSNNLKQDIISWADYRLSTGNGYIKAGWKFEQLLKPDYFYAKGYRVASKQSRQKKLVNTPEDMTEHQHALKDGWRRIYDCGKIRFVYKFN